MQTLKPELEPPRARARRLGGSGWLGAAGECPPAGRRVPKGSLGTSEPGFAWQPQLGATALALSYKLKLNVRMSLHAEALKNSVLKTAQLQTGRSPQLEVRALGFA